MSRSTDVKREVDAILETFIFLYTESRRATKAIAREHGLTGPQVTVLKLLEGVGDLSLSELSDRIRAKNSTVTGIVDRMRRSGLVTRERSEEDRRVAHIRLTAAGAELARAIPVQPMEAFSDALRSLTPTERRALRRTLLKMSDHVRASSTGGSD